MSRVALITGGAQGIGRAIALRLAKDGFNIAVNDMQNNSSKLDQVKRDIESMGRRAVAVVGDVSQDEDVKKMMNCATETLGALNVRIVVFDWLSYVPSHFQ